MKSFEALTFAKNITLIYKRMNLLRQGQPVARDLLSHKISGLTSTSNLHRQNVPVRSSILYHRVIRKANLIRALIQVFNSFTKYKYWILKYWDWNRNLNAGICPETTFEHLHDLCIVAQLFKMSKLTTSHPHALGPKRACFCTGVHIYTGVFIQLMIVPAVCSHH